MGVKSTVTLTREEAEAKYKKLYAQIYDLGISERNEALEDVLAIMNDIVHGGEGFENYWIEG